MTIEEGAATTLLEEVDVGVGKGGVSKGGGEVGVAAEEAYMTKILSLSAEEGDSKSSSSGVRGILSSSVSKPNLMRVNLIHA